VPRDRGSAAADSLSDLFARQPFEGSQLHHAPQRGIDRGKPVQRIVDFD